MQESIAADQAVENEQVAEAAAPKKQKKPINQAKLQDNLWGWLFCLPLIIGTVWFVYSCLIMALMLSFTDYSLEDMNMFEYLAEWTQHFNRNPDTNAVSPFYWYQLAFTNTVPGDTYKWNEMGAYLFNTVFYMIGIPIGMVLSMFFAVCMSRDIKGGNVFRVLYYFPCVASTIAIVYTFKLMFSDSGSGVINTILGRTGDKAIHWLAVDGGTVYSWNNLLGKESTSKFMRDPFWCQGILRKIVIIVMSVWKGLGGTIILYIAGLSGVNAATKEAAQIDGANGWTIFWKVTMPDLYPTIFYNIVTSVIGGMQIYMEPVLLVDEGHLTSGYVSLIYIYGLDPGQGQMVSRGAAYGMILAVIIFVMTMFQFWLDSRNQD